MVAFKQKGTDTVPREIMESRGIACIIGGLFCIQRVTNMPDKIEVRVVIFTGAAARMRSI